MRVASYQAPLQTVGLAESLARIVDQVQACESVGVEILCCPEGILGGLADHAPHPFETGIERRGLEETLAPLSSRTVTTILGFSEIGDGGQLFNAAVVWSRRVVGVYRKVHPAINRSVYCPGTDVPVFVVGGRTFGILICLDSRYPDLARRLATKGAKALFIPTNNGMPPKRGGPELVDEARTVDVGLARENRVSVIRSDVAGRADGLVSYGCSGIVDHEGAVVCAAEQLRSGLLIAEI